MISRTTEGLEADSRNRMKTLDDYGKMTKNAIFAGCDNVTDSATVILSIGAGKEGAKAIDEYIKKRVYKQMKANN